MTLPSQNERLVWGMYPDGLSAFPHLFVRLGVIKMSACKPGIIVTGPLPPADEDSQKCPTCVTALDELDAPFRRPPTMPGPGEQPYSVHRHQELIDAVHAEFEAAGGRWAALQARPLNRRALHREFEALLRQHHDNFPVLLREATGYLDLAVEAAYDSGSDAAHD
jgi:hypothetical protein